MKILPFEQPFVTSFPTMAAVVAICQTKPEQTNAWLASHFIQLTAVDKAYKSNFSVNIADFIDDIGREGLPYYDYSIIHTYRLSRDTIINHWRSPVAFVKDMINDGYYVRWNMDRRYVSCASEYKKSRFFHPIIIYGYDFTHLYVADFFDGSFSLEKAKRAGIRNAFNAQEPPRNNDSRHDYTREVAVHKLRDWPYRFYLEDIRNGVEDYLNSQDSTRKFMKSSAHRDQIFAYGLDCYDVIRKNVTDEGMTDIRPFHVLCDHKAMMSFRMHYLRENQYIEANDFEDLVQELDVLTNRTVLLRNFVIKSFMTKQENVLSWQEKLQETMCNLKEMDAAFMEKFLTALKE